MNIFIVISNEGSILFTSFDNELAIRASLVYTSVGVANYIKTTVVSDSLPGWIVREYENVK